MRQSYGWILKKNEGNVARLNEWKDIFCLERNGLDKFPEDIVLIDAEDKIVLFDGYIENKNDLIRKNHCGSWNEVLDRLSSDKNILGDFRGGFCGFIWKEDRLFFYNDQLGNRAIYYYITDKDIILSSRWNYVVEEIRRRGIKLHFDEQAARYMLTYGYMLDESTFECNIKRLLPGEYIDVYLSTWKIIRKRYYLLDNIKKINISEQDAIEAIDYHFCQAIRREFNKDLEYGYAHLVDLSGGLDSRMTTWVSSVLGYGNQVNITYCQRNYLDFRIAQDIAEYLGHEFIYKSLDDFKWFRDIDEIVSLNNGAALYSGISGGQRFLEQINTSLFGLEHTGMIGDVVLSTFYSDSKTNFSKPKAGQLQYSDKIECSVPEKVLEGYDNLEQFALYTRGILGAQTSYFIRQNYVETASPFLDIDFLDTVFQLPFKYRVNYNIYFKWIKQKYPKAAEFGWERWCGVKPKKGEEWKKYTIYLWRRIKEIFQKPGNIPNTKTMVPFDVYLRNNEEMSRYILDYFNEYIGSYQLSNELRRDMDYLFMNGTAQEKSQVLTVLGILKNFFI